MLNVIEILERAAERANLSRTRYIERDIPTTVSAVTLMPFFGDLRSTFMLSSFLLKRYKEVVKDSRYFILVSWPGHEGFFPYVDEYWTVQDESILPKLFSNAKGLRNESELITLMHRNLNYFFEDVVGFESLESYYDCGFTEKFFEDFETVRSFLPAVPSSTILGEGFNHKLASAPGYKIFVYPVRNFETWHQGRLRTQKVRKEFWLHLIERLLKEGFVPVVYKNFLTYDISPDLANDCIHFWEPNILKVLAAVRATDCVLDIFSGVSKWALAARCPFLSCKERAIDSNLKDYELDDLCSVGLPREYIFSFPTIIEGGDKRVWDDNLVNNIIVKLSSFVPRIDKNALPPTSEFDEIVPYENVRKRRMKKLGTKFIKLKRGV